MIKKLLKTFKLNSTFSIASFVLFVVLCSVWTYLVAIQNLAYSSGTNILPLRSIDDFAFQSSLRTIIQHLSEGNFLGFFKDFSYGYGSIWWNSVSFIVYPFKSNEFLHIVLPRFLSQIFSLLSVLIIYKVLSRKSPVFAILASSILLMSTAVYHVSSMFHNHSFLFFIGSCLLYLSTTKLNFKKMIFVSAMCGIGVATKITFFPVATYFFVYCFFKNGKMSCKEVLIYILIFIVSVLFFISPLNLTFIYSMESIEYFIYSLKNYTPIGNIYYVPRELNLVEFLNFLLVSFKDFYNVDAFVFYSSFVLLFGLTLFFLIKRKWLVLLSCVACICMSLVFLFLYLRGFSGWDVTMYSIPGSVLFISLIYQLLDLKKIKPLIIVLCCYYLAIVFSKVVIDQQHSFKEFTNTTRMEEDSLKYELISKAEKYILSKPEGYYSNIFYTLSLPLIYKMDDRIYTQVFEYFSELNSGEQCNFLIHTLMISPPKNDTLYRPIFYDEKVGGFVEYGSGCPDE